MQGAVFVVCRRSPIDLSRGKMVLGVVLRCGCFLSSMWLECLFFIVWHLLSRVCVFAVWEDSIRTVNGPSQAVLSGTGGPLWMDPGADFAFCDFGWSECKVTSLCFRDSSTFRNRTWQGENGFWLCCRVQTASFAHVVRMFVSHCFVFAVTCLHFHIFWGSDSDSRRYKPGCLFWWGRPVSDLFGSSFGVVQFRRPAFQVAGARFRFLFTF